MSESFKWRTGSTWTAPASCRHPQQKPKDSKYKAPGTHEEVAFIVEKVVPGINMGIPWSIWEYSKEVC